MTNTNSDELPFGKTARDCYHQQGQVYFIRHGESTSNEQNIFAGDRDVILTPYGKLQSAHAGIDIKKKNIKFDAVYVSPLRRARQTCEIVLEVSQALRSPEISTQIDHRISERPQGILTKRNKNLVRLAIGYKRFEEILHSHNEAPPGGEKIEQIYSRVAAFYEEKIIPHLERGENVLVVCHEYVLEPLSAYLNGLPVADYKRLKVPNAKVFSQEDMAKLYYYESNDLATLLKKIKGFATIWSVALYAIAFLLGSVARMLTGLSAMPSSLFEVITIAGLTIVTFYNYLEIDLTASQKEISPVVRNLVYLWMLFRWGVGLLLIFSGFLYQSPADTYKVLWVLFWMMPPALNSPALSLQWGGDLYSCAILSTTLSIITPIALIGIFATSFFPINLKELDFFYLILIVGLGIPAVIAQVWRAKLPLQSHHHHHKWKFIGIFMIIFMNCIIGFQYTPATLISDIFLSMEPTRTIACLQQLILVTLIFSLVRILATITSSIAKQWLTAAESQDIYILITNPNFLLWAALFSGFNTVTSQVSLEYAVFWVALGFYCTPFIDQLLLVKSFTSDLLREALLSSQVVSENVKESFLQSDINDINQLERVECVRGISMY